MKNHHHTSKLLVPRALFHALLAFLAWSLIVTIVAGGDHTDSPLTRGNQAADLADLYVFPVKSTNPEGGTRLVLMMTAHPYASPPKAPDILVPAKRPGTQFSDAVEYIFRLRPAQILGSGADTKITTDGSRELTITCTFDDALEQRVTCVTEARPSGEGSPVTLSAQASVDDESGGGPEHLRVFAGCRSDPFFVDPGKLLYSYLKLPQIATGILKERVMNQPSAKGLLGRVERRAERRIVERVLEKIPENPVYEVINRPRDSAIDWLSFPKFLLAAKRDEAQWLPFPTPFIQFSNVLVIVVELELEKAYGGPAGSDLFALAGETRKAKQIIDRDARPATNNLLFSKSVPYLLAAESIPDLAALQDRWNREDTFAIDPAAAPLYADALQAGMSLYDKSDGVTDWPVPNPMLGVVMMDVLLFDITKPPTIPSSDRNTYFEIEMAHYRGETHRTFGGRTPNDDSIDTFLTWFINGPDRYNNPRRTDGDGKPSRPAADKFPYVQRPHLSLPEP